MCGVSLPSRIYNLKNVEAFDKPVKDKDGPARLIDPRGPVFGGSYPPGPVVQVLPQESVSEDMARVYKYIRLSASRALKILERLDAELGGDRRGVLAKGKANSCDTILPDVPLCRSGTWSRRAWARDISTRPFDPFPTWSVARPTLACPLLRPVRRISKRFLPKWLRWTFPVASFPRARAAFLRRPRPPHFANRIDAHYQ